MLDDVVCNNSLPADIKIEEGHDLVADPGGGTGDFVCYEFASDPMKGMKVELRLGEKRPSGMWIVSTGKRMG